jgi:hypothetical protein
MRFAVGFAVPLALLAACGKSASDGLPPATDWTTADDPMIAMVEKPPVQTPGHAGPKNPHEGVEGAPPLTDDQQQMPNDSTHAFAQQGGGPGDHTHDHAAEPDPHGGGANAPADPNKRIKGTFKVSPKVADKLKPGGVIYLMVKRFDAANQPTGAALAVGRVERVGQGFELGFEDVTGEVLVMARYDQDTDASTKQPGDVIGVARAKIPADNVVIELDTVLP